MSKRGAAEVAAEVRLAIANGQFKQHERLPASRQMAAEFGVARNTLRDALYQLEKEGLLETRAGSGTYVRSTGVRNDISAIEGATPLELIDSRFALEPHICRLCVLHGRREDIEALERLCERMEASTQNATAFAEADTEFHKTLAATTRNNLLIWFISQINLVRSMDEWTRMRHLTLDATIINQYNAHHREILNAIRSREPERAAAKMKEHLEAARLSLTRASDT